jgi:hypothetical protein
VKLTARAVSRGVTRRTGQGGARPRRDDEKKLDQPPLSPVPRQDTFGFQSEKVPFGFDLYSQ